MAQEESIRPRTGVRLRKKRKKEEACTRRACGDDGFTVSRCGLSCTGFFLERSRAWFKNARFRVTLGISARTLIGPARWSGFTRVPGCRAGASVPREPRVLQKFRRRSPVGAPGRGIGWPILRCATAATYPDARTNWRAPTGNALRDREVRSSLTIHVCFLRETVFVGTNNPNMEETGSLENPIPSGKCYLDLNRALSGPIVDLDIAGLNPVGHPLTSNLPLRWHALLGLRGILPGGASLEMFDA